MMAVTTLLMSCLNDNADDTTVYSDTAITQFTLGTLNQYTQTTSSKTGNDTIVKTTLTGSSYKMSIDQLACLIYNTTDLPVGTDIKHVVCTISTKNNGVVALRSMTSDSLRLHANTDSVDFSQPRVFRVYASAGAALYRDYTVTLTVNDTVGATFRWSLEKTDEGLAGWGADKQLAAQGDTVLLQPRDSVVGVTANESYMIDPADGLLKRSRDGGESWAGEQLDDDASLLPVYGTATSVNWPYATYPGATYVLMVGAPRQDDATYMRVWRKIAPKTGDGRWVYMPFDSGNNFPLPRMDYLSLAYYDGTVFCVGSDLVMRLSRDQGITWRENGTYALPASLQGTLATIAVDTKDNLWLLTNGGQLWRGRLK